MQYWEKDEGGIADWAGETVISILVLRDHNSPFLIPNVSRHLHSWKGPPKTKEKKKQGMGHNREITAF